MRSYRQISDKFAPFIVTSSRSSEIEILLVVID